MRLKPLGNRIIVKPLPTQDRIGSILLPESAREKPQECVVIALGTGRRMKDGKRQPFEVAIGDKVLLAKFGGTELQLDGRAYRMADADDIIAIL